MHMYTFAVRTIESSGFRRDKHVSDTRGERVARVPSIRQLIRNPFGRRCNRTVSRSKWITTR